MNKGVHSDTRDSCLRMDALFVCKEEFEMIPLEGQVRIPSGCAVSAMISRDGRRMNGESIIESMVHGIPQSQIL